VGVEELEASIRAALSGEVTLPERPRELPLTDSSNHPELVAAHTQIIRSALQLDLTRVVNLAFGSSNNAVDFASIIGGSQFTDNITYPFASFGVHALAHRDEGIDSPTLAVITDWYMQRTVELVQLLAATPDTDGQSVLDNTVVVLFSEVSQAHFHGNLPLVLFGGKNLSLQGNRCLRYRDHTSNDLWTALAPALKLEFDVFGDPDQNFGALPGLLV
jgi:hypothetical protein